MKNANIREAKDRANQVKATWLDVIQQDNATYEVIYAWAWCKNNTNLFSFFSPHILDVRIPKSQPTQLNIFIFLFKKFGACQVNVERPKPFIQK